MLERSYLTLYVIVNAACLISIHDIELFFGIRTTSAVEISRGVVEEKMFNYKALCHKTFVQAVCSGAAYWYEPRRRTAMCKGIGTCFNGRQIFVACKALEKSFSDYLL